MDKERDQEMRENFRLKVERTKGYAPCNLKEDRVYVDWAKKAFCRRPDLPCTFRGKTLLGEPTCSYVTKTLKRVLEV